MAVAYGAIVGIVSNRWQWRTLDLSFVWFFDPQYNKEIPWRAILTSGPVNTLNACTVCFNWGFYTLVSGLPLFLKEAYHFDITQVKKNGLLPIQPSKTQ